MNRRACGIFALFALGACVLPDYAVVSDRPESDGGAGTSSSPLEASKQAATLLPGADAKCERCVASSCQEQRTSCGADCQSLKWPVSPVWNVTDQADAFVRCLAASCEESCAVRWGCTKIYEWPKKGDSYSVTIRVTDAIRGEELRDIRVKACQAVDPACEQDIGLVSSALTNSLGRAVLSVKPDFVGYFLVEEEGKESDGEKFVPMIVTWSEPIYRTADVLTASMFKPSWIRAVAGAAEMLQEGTGHLILRAQNCLPERYVNDIDTNANGEGVTASLSARGNYSRIYYATKGLMLKLDATSTLLEGNGFAGAFNLGAGPVTVTGVHDGRDVYSGGFTMRPGHVGAIFLLPNSR